MLTFRDIAAGALSAATALTDHLFEQTLPDEYLQLESYYTRQQSDLTGGSIPRARADLDPRVASAIGLTPGAVIQKNQLAAILSGLRADGTELPGKDRKVRRYKQDGKADRIKLAGMDLCLTAPKSFSIAWAFAGTEAERASLMQCHLDARDTILRHIEDVIGHGRISVNGRKTTEPAKLGWISIEHYTARPTVSIKRADPVTGVMGTEIYTLKPDMAGDPNVHSHNIVPNVMVTESGRIVSINQDILAKNIHVFGAIYQAALAENLRKLGVEVDLCDKNLLVKLTAIPDEVCDSFSKRTKDADEAAREEAARRGVDWDALSADARVKFMKGGAKAARRSKADDLANFTAWTDQAAAMGWNHTTAIQGTRPDVDDRTERARDTALPLLADLFKRRAVVSGSEITLQAVRGLIRWGMKSLSDIKSVTKLMVREGVQQDSRHTGLIWTESEGRVRVTTGLHIDQEQELIALAKSASEDTSRSLSPDDLVIPADLDFTTAAGVAQKRVMDTIASGGEFAVAIGAAGAGKSALLRPLVATWQAKGFTVWGTSLSWKVSNRMTDTGIKDTWAIDPFLQRLANGELDVTRNSVVVIDELGQVGTLHLLRLLRLQRKIGFKIVAIGDDKQCASVAAGAVIDLLRKALGSIPELLAIIRQKTEREKQIADLFRAAKAADAIAMKLEDGTAELVDGNAQDAIDRVASLAMERRATGAELTVSAPSNADADAISRAIRRLRQKAGEIDTKEITVPATDGRGHIYSITLAKGDRVRLFSRTKARFENTSSFIGDNGSVLTVSGLTTQGIHLTTANNKTGFVSWETLKSGDRLKLGYGDCLTIDSAQGLTSDEHIFALPSGSHGVDGFKGYVASSRHKHTSWLVVSKGQEKQDVTEHRPLGIADPVTDHDLWMNVAANLSRQPKKESATDLLPAFTDMNRGLAHSFQKTMRFVEGLEKEETTQLKRRASRKKKPVKAPHLVAQFGMQAGM